MNKIVTKTVKFEVNGRSFDSKGKAMIFEAFAPYSETESERDDIETHVNRMTSDGVDNLLLALKERRKEFKAIEAAQIKAMEQEKSDLS
jgi:hypothetical protein